MYNFTILTYQQTIALFSEYRKAIIISELKTKNIVYLLPIFLSHFYFIYLFYLRLR